MYDYPIQITGELSNPVPVTGVTLSNEYLYINSLDTYQLIATVSPANATNKNLIWESDNETVVTVNNQGLMTTNQAGYATITVTTEDGGFTVSCDITVDMPKSVVVTSGSSYLWPGGVSVYTAKVLPSTAANKTVFWSSSDESIATIGETSGMVQALSPGTATITVTTEDGRLSDSCIVNVIDMDINNDDKVDMLDIVMLAQDYGQSTGHPGFEEVDLNRDGLINLFDLILIASHVRS